MEELNITLRGDLPPSVQYETRRIIGELARKHGSIEVVFEPAGMEFEHTHDPRGFTRNDFGLIEQLGGFKPSTANRIWNALIRGSRRWPSQRQGRDGDHFARFDDAFRAANPTDRTQYVPRSIVQELTDSFRDSHDKVAINGIDVQSIDFLRVALDIFQPAPTEAPADPSA